MQSIKKNLWKAIATCMMAFVCFTGLGMKADAAAPAQVTGLSQIALNKGENTIGLSWNPLSQAQVQYEVQYSKGNTAAYTQLGLTDQYRISVGSLTAGSTYYFRVRAIAGSEAGPWSADLKAATAPAGSPGNITQSKATETTVSLKWNAVKGADGYQVLYQRRGSGGQKEVYVKTNTVTLKKLGKNACYNVNIYAYRQDGAAVKAVSSTYAVANPSPATLPTKPAAPKLYLARETIGSYSFKITPRQFADGLQYQVRNSKNKIVVKGTTSYQNTTFTISSSKIKRNQFYKVRVRGYLKLGKKTVYGAWSSDQWTAGMPQMKSFQRNANGFKLTWAKTSGATKYTVYVSTKQASGYKKVGTTSKNTIQVKKYGNKKLVKGKYYYVYAVASKKVGKKTFKGADFSTYRLRY